MDPYTLNLLFDQDAPDAAGLGGGGDSTPTIAEMASADSAPAPEPSAAPAAPDGYDSRFEAIESSLGSLNETLQGFSRGNGNGPQLSQEDAALLQHLQGNSETRNAVNALIGLGTTPSGTPAAAAPTGEMTPAQIQQLINTGIADTMQAAQTQQMQQQVAQARQAENGILSNLFGHDKLAKLRGEAGLSFDDAYAGKGTRAGKFAAVLLDHLAWEQSQKLGNGDRMPLSDTTKADGILSDFFEGLNELKAMALIEASSEPSPDAPTAGVHSGVVDETTGEGSEDAFAHMWDDDAFEKVKATHGSTFRDNVQKATAAATGQPASRAVR